MSTEDRRSDDAVIGFTVKELLQDMNVKLHDISQKLDNKADKADVVGLTSRVTALESDKLSRDSHTDRRRWLIPIGSGIAMSIASPFLWVFVAKLH